MSSESAWSFAFSGRRMLTVHGDPPRVPDEAELAAALSIDPAGLEGAEVPLRPAHGRPCRAFDLPEAFEPPPGFQLVSLRRLAGEVPTELFRTAGTAFQKVEWLRTHGFCSRCGSPTERHRVHEAMACTSCGHLHFPRLAPAIIVLVQRGTEMLLARSPRFLPGVYSTLAGFVEPGESLEETVHREVFEEVGVRVRDVRYFGSQPWPFPHSLMVGFIADWESGEIRPDPTEIEDARWFTAATLPELPFRVSIARSLIDDFLERTARSRE